METIYIWESLPDYPKFLSTHNSKEEMFEAAYKYMNKTKRCGRKPIAV